jgi:hypothetical protein
MAPPGRNAACVITVLSDFLRAEKQRIVAARALRVEHR